MEVDGWAVSPLCSDPAAGLPLLFFATEHVTRQGYDDTYFSLVALLAVEFALLIPVGLMNKVWYDGICLAVESIALYFLVTSIWYWVRTNRV